MPSITIYPEVATSIAVKNTFIDVQREVTDLPRRSNSLPRLFKLGDYAKNSATGRALKFGSCTGANAVDTDNSTNVSEKDFPDYCSECTEDNYTFHQNVEIVPELEEPPAAETGIAKVTLSLDNMVTEESRRKLRAQAQPFKSARAPPTEVVKMIASAVEVLMTVKDIVDVQVHDGGMGGTTTIMARSSCSQPDPQCTFPLVKDSLLNSAEQSENTYVLGYGAQPFKNLDHLSFSTKLAHVPAAHRDAECWDYYEKGFCSQCSSCCWNHPSEIDTMRIIVMINSMHEDSLVLTLLGFTPEDLPGACSHAATIADVQPALGL